MPLEGVQVGSQHCTGGAAEIDELAAGALDDLAIRKLDGRGMLDTHSDLDGRFIRDMNFTVIHDQPWLQPELGVVMDDADPVYADVCRFCLD